MNSASRRERSGAIAVSIGRRPIGVLLLATATWLGGCGDPQSSAGANDGTVGERTNAIEIIPPGDECEFGGVLIETGIDENDNGELDDDEVDETAVICNGAPGDDGDPGDPGDPGDDGAIALIDLEPLAPGDDCEAGGYTVSVGIDANGNGELDGDEVAGSESLCTGLPGVDGAPGAQPLARVDDLAAGDDCPAGGVAYNAGLDDGDGDDGVAGDGTLQDGEIDTTNIVCDAEPLVDIELAELDRPDGDAGAALIDASGGQATAGSGGEAGSMAVSVSPGSYTGHIEMYETGVVEPPPAPPNRSFEGGDVLVTITTDTTVGLGEPDGDGLFVEPVGNFPLFRKQSGVVEAVTGLRIEAEATLTIPATVDNLSTAAFTVLGSIDNRGTIAFQPAFLSAVFASQYLGAAGSQVDLSTGLIGAVVTQWFQNAGLIGPDPEVSGGSQVQIQGTFGVVNSGRIRAGQNLGVFTGFGSIWNTGTVEMIGGLDLGVNGNGAANLTLIAELGDVIHTGTIDAGGPDSEEGAGAPGRAVLLEAFGGSVWSSGTIDTSGGSSDVGAGGDGAAVQVVTLPYEGTRGGIYPGGDIEISGSWDLSGGDGVTSAGNGGTISINVATGDAPLGQGIRLLGYDRFDLTGGPGASGGPGSSLMATHGSVSSSGFPTARGPSGGIANTVAVLTRGGDATSGSGGEGGDVLFEVNDDYAWAAPQSVVLNEASINTRGGDGPTGAGGGGGVRLTGTSGVDNSGTIVTRGGQPDPGCVPNEGALCLGRPAGDVFMYADLGELTNSGDIAGDGGTGITAGGRGTDVEMIGAQVVQSGDISADGGDPSGDGGSIFVLSLDGETNNTGTYSIEGGADDENPGDEGSLVIDWVVVRGDVLQGGN